MGDAKPATANSVLELLTLEGPRLETKKALAMWTLQENVPVVSIVFCDVEDVVCAIRFSHGQSQIQLQSVPM